MKTKHSEEFEAISEAYRKAGGNSTALIDKKLGSLIISNNKVIAKNEIYGLKIKHREKENEVNIKIYISEGVNIKDPIHLCFGMLHEKGKQIIKSEFFIGDGARVKFLAHCSFPNSNSITHTMLSKMHVGKNAKMSYIEEHFHSNNGAHVVTRTEGEIKEGGKLSEKFKLSEGKVGTLDVVYDINQGKRSICELLTKVYGRKDDKVQITESLHLNGEYAAGTAKSRVVLNERAIANVISEVEGNAPYSHGHIDCHEIVQGKHARASSTPKISVKNPLAQVTHEAAIGRINKKELETLMARGLSEEEAVDIIVKGLLK